MFRKRRLAPGHEQELRVAAAILASSMDPRAKPLFEQLARGRKNLREERSDGFIVTVTSTKDDLVVDLDQPVESEWVRVPDTQSGRLLEFRVTLRAGGFFHSLEGRAVEGDWPAEWQVNEVALGKAAQGSLVMPNEP